jgi:hypothetical protein
LPSSTEAAIVAAFLVAPGFITAWVYARMAAGAELSDARRILVSVIYGCWNLLSLAVLGCATGINGIAKEWIDRNDVSSVGEAVRRLAEEPGLSQAGVAGGALVACFILPAFWGYLLACMANRHWAQWIVDRLPFLAPKQDPRPMWDYWMQEETPKAVRVKLKDGPLLMGFLRGVSRTDQNREMWLVGVQWWDEERAQWTEDATADHVYVRGDDTLYVQSVKVEERPQSTDSPAARSTP